MTTRLLLVRHGQTAYNAEVRFMGQLDIPMDEIGRLQARAVARRLSAERPVAMYCSGLWRAFETASAIRSAIASHPELRTDERLTEGHFGAWQGKTYDSLKVQDAERLARWEADRLHAAPPEGESLQQIADRVGAAYADICAENRDKTVIIVAHGGSLQVLLTLALGVPLETYWKLWVSNASVSELRLAEWGATLHLLNDTSHLTPSP
jgi:alpha-ribazole phosphatase/probable phosphoglycerate mutase